MDVLVCIKRVPDSSGAVLLTADGQAVDARHVGFTLSAHESCAVELGVEVAEQTGGSTTVLTVGPQAATDQLRSALSVGASRASLVVLPEDRVGDFGPADIAAEIAQVLREHAAAGRDYGLVLLGNDAADTGDFQVPVRLAYLLDRPVVTGIKTVRATGDRIAAVGDAPDGGTEHFDLPVPAVVAVLEGGVEPRYPTIKGRMAARKTEIEVREPVGAPVGSGRIRMLLPPPTPSQVQVLGEGPQVAPAVVDLLAELGVLR